MSLLENRLKKDQLELEEAEAKVENMAAIRPTAEEIQIVDEMISRISKQFSERISAEGLSDAIRAEITAKVEKESLIASEDYERRSRIRKLALTSMFGLGPLESYMKPSSTASNIVVHRYNHILVEDHTGMHRIAAEFNSEEHLRNVIQRIVQQAGRQINLAIPAVDSRLPDGSRIHATIPPITPDGATLTIRRFNNRKLEAEDYLHLKTMNRAMLDFLRSAVRGRLSILVSGGTDSGKTTLLNLLSSFIPKRELIVTIEDNCELQLRQPNVRRMETREATKDLTAIDMQELVRHALRMRPDRIVVGEIRDGAVVDMMSAMLTGHEGSLSTVHTDSPRILVDSRLPILFSQYRGGALSRDTQTYMTSEAIQLIIQISKEPSAIGLDPKEKTDAGSFASESSNEAEEENTVRKITHITAVNGIDFTTNTVQLVDIFRYNSKTDDFDFVSPPPQNIINKLARRKIDILKQLGKEVHST